jgi:two-component system cell cycle sensor histidine kinase PleC
VQVLANLLGNAAKYTPEGGQLKVKMELCGERVSIEVSDNGAGIPAEARSRLFDPFFTTKADGTGLGLAIARSLSELHGGSLRIRSRVDVGTVVRVRLPIPPSALMAIAARGRDDEARATDAA